VPESLPSGPHRSWLERLVEEAGRAAQAGNAQTARLIALHKHARATFAQGCPGVTFTIPSLRCFNIIPQSSLFQPGPRSALPATTGSTRTPSRTRHKSLESPVRLTAHAGFGGRPPGKGPGSPNMNTEPRQAAHPTPLCSPEGMKAWAARRLVRQPQYAEPDDMGAPLPHGSLITLRAESAICRSFYDWMSATVGCVGLAPLWAGRSNDV
jgi:hypothetical protein